MPEGFKTRLSVTKQKIEKQKVGANKRFGSLGAGLGFYTGGYPLAPIPTPQPAITAAQAGYAAGTSLFESLLSPIGLNPAQIQARAERAAAVGQYNPFIYWAQPYPMGTNYPRAATGLTSPAMWANVALGGGLPKQIEQPRPWWEAMVKGLTRQPLYPQQAAYNPSIGGGLTGPMTQQGGVYTYGPGKVNLKGPMSQFDQIKQMLGPSKTPGDLTVKTINPQSKAAFYLPRTLWNQLNGPYITPGGVLGSQTVPYGNPISWNVPPAVSQYSTPIYLTGDKSSGNWGNYGNGYMTWGRRKPRRSWWGDSGGGYNNSGYTWFQNLMNWRI